MVILLILSQSWSDTVERKLTLVLELSLSLRIREAFGNFKRLLFSREI